MTETREQWIEREARGARERYWNAENWDRVSEAHKQLWRNVVAPYYPEPLRVPVDVDGLADAIRCADSYFWTWDDISESSKKGYRKCARAALAYLNIESCAKQEYDPADVALTPSERAELENLRAECKRLRIQQPETRPVKIRFDVTAEELFWEMDDDNLPYPIENVEGIALVQRAMDHLAARAVLEVPPGVPSVEELRQIGIGAHWASANLICNNDDDHECARARAIRDAVLAGIQRREWTDADVEELAERLRIAIYVSYDALRGAARAALAWFDGKRGE